MIGLETYIPLREMGIMSISSFPKFDMLGYTINRYVFLPSGLDDVKEEDLEQFDILFTYSNN